MPGFIPVTITHLRVWEAMQEYVMRIGVALKRRDQIQYGKPVAPAEILDPVIRVKQVGHADILLTLRPPNRVGINLTPDRRGDYEELRTVLLHLAAGHRQ